MNFKTDDNSLEKVIDIFYHLEKVLNINLDNYQYEDSKSDTYLKAKVSDETCFRKDKDKTVNIIPNEKTKHNCRVYYKCNLFTTIIMKPKIVILKYFYEVVDINFLLIID